MSLMKIRERQKESPAGKEFRRQPNRGRAVLFGVLALLMIGGAGWFFLRDNTLAAGLILVGAVVAAALSYHHWSRLPAQ